MNWRATLDEYQLAGQLHMEIRRWNSGMLKSISYFPNSFLNWYKKNSVLDPQFLSLCDWKERMPGGDRCLSIESEHILTENEDE